MNNNPNQMLLFITLHEVNDVDTHAPIEINPNFIIFMRRQNGDIPTTQLHMSNGVHVEVRETPEEIAELQMTALTEMMTNLMGVTTQLMLQMQEELDGGGYGGLL